MTALSAPIASAAGSVAARFTLIDHHGEAADEHRFRGRFALVFFGFTHCRVVCPRVLGKLERVMAAIGADAAARVQPLYITVDPQRDTSEVLERFLRERYPSFLGLTGTAEQIAAAKAAFRVFAARRETGDDDYAMPHTAITYVLGPAGALVDHWPDVLDESALAQRLSALLSRRSGDQ